MNRAVRAAGRLAWWTLRVGLLLAGAVLVFTWTTWRTIQSHFDASKVAVPDVRGMTEEDAEARLAVDGLVLEVSSREPHESIEPGRVTYQTPLPGIGSRKGRDVKVVVSQGAMRIATPNLVGRTRRESLIELRNRQLQPGDVVTVHSPRDADDVIAQVPAPGGALDPSGRVGLLVSQGPRRRAYVMPDLRGRRLSEAQRLFGEVGMRVAEVREQFAPGEPEGVVQSQSPERGSMVMRETPIRLVVSRSSPLPITAAPPSGLRVE